MSFFKERGSQDAMWMNNEHNLQVKLLLNSRLSAEGLGIQSVLVTPPILEYIPDTAEPPRTPTHKYRLLRLPEAQEMIALPKQPRLRPYVPPTLCNWPPKPS